MFIGSLAEGGTNIIFFFILGYQPVDVCIAYFSNNLNQVAHSVTIYRIAKFYFRLHFITFGNSHLAHVITKATKPGQPANHSILPLPSPIHLYCLIPTYPASVQLLLSGSGAYGS